MRDLPFKLHFGMRKKEGRAEPIFERENGVITDLYKDSSLLETTENFNKLVICRSVVVGCFTPIICPVDRR